MVSAVALLILVIKNSLCFPCHTRLFDKLMITNVKLINTVTETEHTALSRTCDISIAFRENLLTIEP